MVWAGKAIWTHRCFNKIVRDWSLITQGQGGGGATKRQGGHVKFYPYKKGGRRKKF